MSGQSVELRHGQLLEGHEVGVLAGEVVVGRPVGVSSQVQLVLVDVGAAGLESRAVGLGVEPRVVDVLTGVEQVPGPDVGVLEHLDLGQGHAGAVVCLRVDDGRHIEFSRRGPSPH